VNSGWAEVYRHAGPYCSVYLDISRASETGSHELALRWRQQREQLESAGAPDTDLAALDRAVDDDHTAGRAGLVMVAAAGEVVFSDHLNGPPRRQGSSFTPLPNLMPYLAQSSDRFPYLLVVTDHTGADIAPVQRFDGQLPATDELEVHPEHQPVHKTRRNDWSERHFQNRVENNWTNNARAAAETIAAQVRSKPVELVVVAGEPRSRSMLMTELTPLLPQRSVAVESDRGDPQRSPELLVGEIRDAVLRRIWAHRRETLEHLNQNLGRGEYAAAGVAGVVAALRTAAVDTLIVSDDPTSTLRAHVGAEPLQFGLSAQDLHDMGVTDPEEDRLDSALLRAVAGTGAHIMITPNAHDYLPDGIGALLRYDAGG
jgi:hypothetical protein